MNKINEKIYEFDALIKKFRRLMGHILNFPMMLKRNLKKEGFLLQLLLTVMNIMEVWLKWEHLAISLKLKRILGRLLTKLMEIP